MGTNYYFEYNTKTTCKECGHSGEVPKRLHMGKSSAGWYYALRVYGDDGPNTLEEWCKLITSNPSGVIRNEYGRTISFAEWLNCVLARNNSQYAPLTVNDRYTRYDHTLNLMYPNKCSVGIGSYYYADYEFS